MKKVKKAVGIIKISQQLVWKAPLETTFSKPTYYNSLKDQCDGMAVHKYTHEETGSKEKHYKGRGNKRTAHQSLKI